MVQQSMIGHVLPVVTARVERGRLRGFRRMIGSANIYDDRVPPTYLFALEMLEADRPLAFVEELDVDLGKVLHSEQAFTYHAPVMAGDEIVLRTVIADVFEKKGGALVFVVQHTEATNQRGERVAHVRRTLVIRN